ncbi:hypothetical protein LR48_Vigan08g060900 [Vigna angularis]|uniref:Uncharacterized protein n=2 Tax=Phaseolus angularis TaxID=3914 RepID=A0A0L9V4B1_PHAAN|nr:hypothetical protein LR48_Vigan08g060900 [Vigna angularis]BAT89696.1 hypothetical protein VIGAN_06072200 [Vigna angularis var. angularis]
MRAAAHEDVVLILVQQTAATTGSNNTTRCTSSGFNVQPAVAATFHVQHVPAATSSCLQHPFNHQAAAASFTTEESSVEAMRRCVPASSQHGPAGRRHNHGLHTTSTVTGEEAHREKQLGVRERKPMQF